MKGSSNWIERNAALANLQVFGTMEIDPHSDNLNTEIVDNEPVELRNIGNIINERFRVSSPPIADPFNPILQVNSTQGRVPNNSTSEDNYSPTTPLDMEFTSSDDTNFQVEINSNDDSDGQTQVVLALPVNSAMFGFKKRDIGKHTRAQSLNTALPYSAMDEDVKKMCFCLEIKGSDSFA